MRFLFISLVLLLGDLGASSFVRANAADEVMSPDQVNVLLKTCGEQAHDEVAKFDGPAECKEATKLYEESRGHQESATAIRKKIRSGEIDSAQKGSAEQSAEQEFAKSLEVKKKADVQKALCLHKRGKPMKFTYRDHFEKCTKAGRANALRIKSCELAQNAKATYESLQNNLRDLGKSAAQQKNQPQTRDLVTGKTQLESLMSAIADTTKQYKDAKNDYARYNLECQKSRQDAIQRQNVEDAATKKPVVAPTPKAVAPKIPTTNPAAKGKKAR
jgi:hypothetical protein